MQVKVVFVSFALRTTELLVIEFGRNPGKILYLEKKFAVLNTGKTFRNRAKPANNGAFLRMKSLAAIKEVFNIYNRAWKLFKSIFDSYIYWNGFFILRIVNRDLS